jgi:hypothetical protein
MHSSIGVSTISLYNKTSVLSTSTYSFSNHLNVEFMSEVTLIDELTLHLIQLFQYFCQSFVPFHKTKYDLLVY